MGDEIDVQYEIAGPGGGTWNLSVRQDDGVLRPGASAQPHLTVRVLVEGWLALWAGAESPSSLLRCGRLQILPARLAAIATPDLPRLGLLGPLREIQYTTCEDVACAHDGFCSHAEPLWPPALDHVDFRLLGFSTVGGPGRHDVPPEVRRLRTLVAMSWPLLAPALGLGIAVGTCAGLGSLVGWVAAAWTGATLYWYLKRPIVRRLEAGCRQSPRVFGWMVQAGRIV